MTKPEHEEYAEEIEDEEMRVNETMRAAEIFAAGFKLGLAKAGLESDPESAFKDWLLERFA